MSPLPPEDHLDNAIADLQQAIKGFQLRQGSSLQVKKCKKALGQLIPKKHG